MYKPYIVAGLRVLFGCLIVILFTQVSYIIEGAAFSIPITGQSFSVLLVAYLLGGMQGGLAITLYLLLGAFGLPVFAEGKSGLSVLMGPSGGFLYGFLLACLVANWMFRGRNVSLNTAVQFMMLGTVVILLVGGLHLRLFTDWATVINSGIKPFLPGAAIKVIMGGMLAYIMEKYISLKYFRFTTN